MSPDCVFNLQNKNPEDKIEQTFQISLRTIENILKFIGYRNAPFELMVGVLSAAQSLFYPTDKQIHNSVLAYYRQREWRLISGIAVAGKAQCRSLNELEKEKLISINRNFWTRELNDGVKSLRRIDEAVVMESFEGNPISKIISCVKVPAEAYDEAKKLYGEVVNVQEE